MPENTKPYIVAEDRRATDLDIFNLLESRRIEAQRQMELLHKRIGDLRDELYEEVASSHKEIMKEIREMKEEQRAHAKDMSERVGVLERWKWLIVGGAASAGFLLALAMQVASYLN